MVHVPRDRPKKEHMGKIQASAKENELSCLSGSLVGYPSSSNLSMKVLCFLEEYDRCNKTPL